MDNWEPLKVIEKDGGRVIVIKDFRFNPELHEKVEDFKVTKIEVEEEVAEKPFACELCEKTFKTEPALRAHHTRFHKE
jgi:hypothetical protein